MSIDFFYRIIKPILYKLDPEKSHNWAFYLLSRLELIVGKFFAVPYPPLVKPIYVRKLFFNNRIGLAAGLDKNGYPLGLQIIGKPFDEQNILNIAYSMEEKINFKNKVTDWWI